MKTILVTLTVFVATVVSAESNQKILQRIQDDQFRANRDQLEEMEKQTAALNRIAVQQQFADSDQRHANSVAETAALNEEADNLELRNKALRAILAERRANSQVFRDGK